MLVENFIAEGIVVTTIRLYMGVDLEGEQTQFTLLS